MLNARIYMREPSLCCQPTARASLLLVLLCRERAGPTPAPLLHRTFSLPQQIIFLHIIKDVSRRLSGICRLSPVLLQLSLLPYVFSFPSILHVPSLIQSHLTPCTESRICTAGKNKHPFFCVDCISLLCPVISFLISVY